MNNNLPNNQNPLSPELVNKLLAVQEKDLALKAQDIELRKQADSNSFEFAKVSLTANSKDREEQRKHIKSIVRYVLIFVFCIILILAMFLSLALYLNKDQVALEIVKAIIFITSGGLGGYALGKKSEKEPK